MAQSYHAPRPCPSDCILERPDDVSPALVWNAATIRIMSSTISNRFTISGLAIFIACASSPAFSQQASQTLPVVASTGTPDYPPSAENARIQGAVKASVSTGQGKVTWVQVEDGPPELWRAAQAYLRTWQFQSADPAMFRVTLQYRIEEVKICGPQTVAVFAHFPTEVDIVARDTKSCDIVATVLAQNQPVAVKFDVQLNGEAIAPPSAVNLNFDGHALALPLQNGQFTVPLDVVRAKSVDFALSLPGEDIRTTVDGADFASENWTLRLADKAFGDDFQEDVPKGAKAKFACVLTFDSHYASVGSFKFDPRCRTSQKRGK